MDNENRRYSNGEQSPPGFTMANSGLGRPPPGLERNFGYHQNLLKENTSSPPPPGLGSPFGFPVVHPSNNNVFFPTQSPPPYSFYSPLQTQVYGNPFDKGYQGRNDTGGIPSNGNYFPQQDVTSNFFSGAPARESSFVDTCPGRIESSEPVRDISTAVIEPMIENLMGSMGTSNGTYSHFGPSTTNSIVTGLSFGQGSQVRKTTSPIMPSMSVGAELNPVINTDPFNSSQEWEFQRKMEAKIRQKQLLQKQQQTNIVPFGGFKGNSNTSVNTATPSFASTVRNGTENSIKESNVQVQELLPTNPSQILTDLSSSNRTQTPAKPSYLEILTKSCSTENNSVSKSRNFLEFQEETKSKGDVGPLFQGQNQSHRKSLDSFSSLIGSSSPTASNPSTASSSPITKPRIQKGKENVNGSSDSSSGGSKSSTRRSTPSGTPTHQRPSAEPTKKVTPVVTGNTCWIKKLSGRAINNGKNNGKVIGHEASFSGKAIPHFEFEIEDIDILESGDGKQDDMEIEKTKAQQLTSNEEKNTGSASKKKDKRRLSANVGTASELGSNNGSSLDRRSSGCENKLGNSNITTPSMYFTFGGRKGNTGKEKSEKLRTRKEERNCAIRRFRVAIKQWTAHLMKAVTWLWTLLMNVTVLSLTLGYTLMEDLLIWWKITALPTFRQKMELTKQKMNSAWKRLMNILRRKKESPTSPKPESFNELLSVLGPERNIALPGTGDEALRRLLSVRGQDPYSILGVRSDSAEETIRRYYKKQAVLVHPDKNLVPGAEEAFKILAKAFEMVGEPGSRLKYHEQLLEAHAKEKFIGEFGELFEELRKKMETACSTIRCTKCKVRHKKNKTTRPLFAARYCAQCRIHHGAREGELWAEKGGMFSFSWQFYACMGNQIWEINEWGRCQRSSLKHLKPNAHSVIYRLVSGGQQGGKGRAFPPGGGGMTNSSTSSTGPNDEDDLFDPRMEDWDSLINNLYRNSGNAPNHASNSTTAHKGSSKPSTGPGSVNQNGNGINSSAAAMRKRKGKKK